MSVKSNKSNTLQDRLRVIGQATRLDDVNDYTVTSVNGITEEDMAELKDIQEHVNAIIEPNSIIPPQTALVITQPASGATNVEYVEIKIDPYRVWDHISWSDRDTDQVLDWELSTDPGFVNITDSSYGDKGNVVSWYPKCNPNTQYWVRCRIGIGAFKSRWSVPVEFTTASVIEYVDVSYGGSGTLLAQDKKHVGAFPSFLIEKSPDTTSTLTYQDTTIRVYNHHQYTYMYDTSVPNGLSELPPIYENTVAFQNTGWPKAISVLDKNILGNNRKYVVKIRHRYTNSSNADRYSSWLTTVIQTKPDMNTQTVISFKHGLNKTPPNSDEGWIPLARLNNSEVIYRPLHSNSSTATRLWFKVNTKSKSSSFFMHDGILSSGETNTRMRAVRYDNTKVLIASDTGQQNATGSGGIHIVYDMVNNTYTQGQLPLSQNRHKNFELIANPFTDDIYFIANNQTTNSAILYRLDKTSDVWVTIGITQGLGTRYRYIANWLDEERIIVSFGYNSPTSSTERRECLIYNTTTDTWTTTAQVPAGTIVNELSDQVYPLIGAIELYDGKIGYHNVKKTDGTTVDLLYDSWTDTWREFPNYTQQTNSGAGATLERGVMCYLSPRRPSGITKLYW